MRTVAGEPNDRDRWSEFDNKKGCSKNELLALLEEATRIAVSVIDGLPQSDLASPLRVLGFDLTVLTAIYSTERSAENRRAMASLAVPYDALSPAFSILRQELDSMIRIIYLLHISEPNKRDHLIRSTLEGKKWTVPTARGRTFFRTCATTMVGPRMTTQT